MRVAERLADLGQRHRRVLHDVVQERSREHLLVVARSASSRATRTGWEMYAWPSLRRWPRCACSANAYAWRTSGVAASAGGAAGASDRRGMLLGSDRPAAPPTDLDACPSEGCRRGARRSREPRVLDDAGDLLPVQPAVQLDARPSRCGRRRAARSRRRGTVDEHRLHPGRGGGPDGQAPVAVVVVVERHERPLVADEEGRRAVAQPLARLGQGEAQPADLLELAAHTPDVAAPRRTAPPRRQAQMPAATSSG